MATAKSTRHSSRVPTESAIYDAQSTVLASVALLRCLSGELENVGHFAGADLVAATDGVIRMLEQASEALDPPLRTQ